MVATIPAGPAGRVISFSSFVAAVQDAGPLATVGEADRAARAVLAELAGCLSRGAAENLADRLPRPLRQLVKDRSFDTSMVRFAPRVFLQRMAGVVGVSRAAPDTRAVLRALDMVLPPVLREQLHAQLVSVWGPLTRAEDGLSSRDATGPAPS